MSISDCWDEVNQALQKHVMHQMELETKNTMQEWISPGTLLKIEKRKQLQDSFNNSN